MARSSIIPLVLGSLEPWLEKRMLDWQSQPASQRSPTLPDVAGKVDVRNLVRALGLPSSYEQHFYNKAELRSLVNAVADAQGLRGIGSRSELDTESKALDARLSQVQRDRSEYAQALAEAHVQIERLRRENASLRARLDHMSDTGMRIRFASDSSPS
jgi:hypothetical protein